MDFRFIYTGIRVKDMDESIKFYTEILGMEIAEKRERTEPTKGEGVTLKSPDSNQILELNFYESDSPFYVPYENGEDLDHLAFDVENLENVVADLRSKCIEIVVEPYQIGARGMERGFHKRPKWHLDRVAPKKTSTDGSAITLPQNQECLLNAVCCCWGKFESNNNLCYAYPLRDGFGLNRGGFDVPRG